MKFLKISQSYFANIDWNMPSPPQSLYSQDFRGLAKEYKFLGYFKGPSDTEPRKLYEVMITISEKNQYKIQAINSVANSEIDNKTFNNVQDFKKALYDMNIPPEVLGLKEEALSSKLTTYRLTKQDAEPKELNISVVSVDDQYSVRYVISRIQDGKVSVNRFFANQSGITKFSLDEADVLARRIARTAVKRQGYTLPSDPNYIQARNKRKTVTSQDYGGYYSGDVPEYQGSLIGSPNVDMSQLSSQFGDANKSVELVNKFDPSLLKNIVYMFNFAKSGVYGVYVPALDRAVKTKELEKRLQAMGYEIVEENGMLKAYPKGEEKDQATISAEIKRVYDDLEMKGGSVLGINVADTRNEVEGSFNNLREIVPEEMHGELKNDLMIAHMAATIAHEATHAHGHEGEGPPTQVETSLLNYALGEIQQKYNIEGELGLKRGSSSNWYKVAQQSPFFAPSGSDLTGRHGTQGQNLDGQADWAMMAQQSQHLPIEQMLNRDFQSPLPPDLDQEHDIYELQLRKNTRDDWSLPPNMIYDELLREGRVEDGSEYKSLEELLEDQRPQPLMMPMKKASKIHKFATVFGWMNNLEISDGSTIPGMGDRVMAWDDRDESFAEEESWIKQQPRYNPSYDLKGFYYRWIEPRNKPELWDTSVRDLSNTHPAKRFAQNQNNDLGFIVDALRKIRTQLLQGKLSATRFICSEDILTVIAKAMGDVINIDVFLVGEKDDEEVYACWLHKDADSNDIEAVERAIQEKDEKSVDLMSKLVGCKSTLSEAVDEVMQVVKDVTKDYGLYDIYAVGSYAREVSLGDSTPEVEEIEFTSDNPTSCLKLGYLVAETLGIEPELSKKYKAVSFIHKGVPVYFNGGKKIPTVENWMRKHDIGSPSNVMHDICNKDFTLNMQAYNPASGTVTSVFGEPDGVKTLFDPNDIIPLNPFIILRAVYLSVRHGLPIDETLGEAIVKYSPLLAERYPVEMLQFAKTKIEGLGKEEAQDLFQKYELDQILDFGE